MNSLLFLRRGDQTGRSRHYTGPSLLAERLILICLQVVNAACLGRRAEVAHAAKVRTRGRAPTTTPPAAEEAAALGPREGLEAALGPVAQGLDEVQRGSLVGARQTWSRSSRNEERNGTYRIRFVVSFARRTWRFSGVHAACYDLLQLNS